MSDLIVVTEDVTNLIVVTETGALTVFNGTGTVYGVSIVSANGFAGSVAKSTTLPAITLSTTITGIIKGNGTSIAAATAGTDYIVPGGALGTPSSGTLTSCTGLPISTGVSGLGTSVAAFLATPNSANLKTAITDETGTGGSLVFATSPTLVTPILGVAAATSVNKVAITQPATGSTLTIVDGATLTASATASVSNTNTGDNAVNTLYSSLISDATVVLTNGTGISITGTYPSFTIDCDITQYTDTDARLALSAGTGISYDDTTGIITNDDPDQTVVLTDGADITITGTYPNFTIAYSGAGGGTGTVTTASVVSANGFAGTVATDTTTPAITISTSITGLLKGDGTAISAATSGTDYVVPSGSITGNAATVTTNADLTGVITSKGNATSIASQTGTGTTFAMSTSPTLVTPTIGAATATSLNKITVTAPATGATLTIVDGATLTASATASVSGTNSGDNATNTTYSSLISNATHTGDATGSTALTVVKINGVLMSGLGTGILKNTTTTGVPSIAVAADFPVLNQNSTGTAAGLSTTLAVLSGGTGVTTSTGSGANALATSPTLVTPILGVATATTVNKVTVTAPATGATLTIVDGATLTASATASVSGTNTGDAAINSLYSGLISNATHTGDATGSTALTVVKINGVLMSGLATGILKNTTTTGVPSIAVAADFPVLNQNSTGSAASLSATLAVLSGGTGVTTSTGSGANALATSPVLVTPLLGTPTSGTLTSCTGLPISTGVSGLGTGAATFLATPTSANLIAMMTDETGTGANVFATSPALTTPTITGLIEVKTAPTISAGVLALDCTLGNVFHVSLNAAITSITFSNIPTGAYGLTLAFTMDGTARAVTWGSAIKWASGGTAPTLTSTLNKVDIFCLTTWDSGTTWFSMVGGQNF